MTMSTAPHQHTVPRPHRSLHLAWWSLGLFPVAFVAAMVLGEGIPAWFGYNEPSLDTTPWYVIGLAGLSALLVFASPVLVTAHFSRQAAQEGEPDARLPLLVVGIVVGAFVLLNLFGALAQLLF